jgi:hypothetical protein
MYHKIQLTKATLLTAILIFGTSLASMATDYTATVSGNWSSSLTWGGTAPSFSTTGADNITIPVGVTVTQDADVTINNASAVLLVVGTLTGTTNLNLTAGTLTGAGTVVLNDLTVGTGGWITSVGTISVSQLANSQATLAISAVMSVSNTVVLNAGVAELAAGGVLNLATNTTINMAGGTFNALAGLPTLAGTYNLLYTGAVSAIGAEASLTGLHNVTVNLASATNQLSMAGNLSVTGVLSLQQGVLNLAGNTLTIIGGVTTTAGSVAGSATSNLVVNGTGSIGSLAFTAGAQTLGNLTLAILGSGSVSLASDVAVDGITTLTSGNLNLNGNTLNIAGTIAAGTGTIIGSSTSGIILSGTGLVGTLPLGTAASTIGTLTVNIASAGNVLLSNALTVSNTLTLLNGSLDLSGQSLTIGGVVNSSGGTISGSLLSDITFNGSGSAGTLALTAASSTINNLTINIGSGGSVALASPVTVAGVLTLAQGTIDIAKNDLTMLTAATITGGSAASYVVTSDTGSLIMTVANAGANGLFQVGTAADYAPVTVTNNSTLAGTFFVLAHEGVLLNGTTGPDISQFQPVVNTSWNVESSLTTGANVNLLMGWNTSMQVNAFDNTQAYISHYTAGAWNTSAITASTILGGGLFSLALTGVTSFSPFAVFGHNVTLGVVAVNSKDVMEVYPNPSTDKLTIQIASASAVTNVEITDISGQTVARFELTNGDNTINIASLNTGSYFVKVSNSEMSAVKKFVKI